MSREEDENAVLRVFADQYPSLKALRAASPPSAKAFLEATKNQSENWPISALIDGYLDSMP